LLKAHFGYAIQQISEFEQNPAKYKSLLKKNHHKVHPLEWINCFKNSFLFNNE
jgi:hypothetical protein